MFRLKSSKFFVWLNFWLQLCLLCFDSTIQCHSIIFLVWNYGADRYREALLDNQLLLLIIINSCISNFTKLNATFFERGQPTYSSRTRQYRTNIQLTSERTVKLNIRRNWIFSLHFLKTKLIQNMLFTNKKHKSSIIIDVTKPSSSFVVWKIARK